MGKTIRKARNELEDKLRKKIEELTGTNEKLRLEIAELRQTEKLLRENETRFKRAQHMGMVGSWEWDLIGNKTSWSDELYHIFSVKPEQFDPDAYEAFQNCIHINDRQFVQETITKCLNEKTNFDIEYRIIRPDGTLRDIHALGEVICNKTGNPVKLIGTSQDITARKQIGVRLKRSENIGKIGNWEYDLINERIFWSDQVFELFGRDPGLGPPTVDEEAKYYSEEVKNRLRKYTEQVIETGEPVRDYEFLINRENGNTCFFIGSMFAGMDKNGRVTKLFGIFQDITERKHAQQEITRHLKFEEYISELAIRFMNLPTNKVETEITKTLHWMVDYFEVDRVTLLKFSEDKKKLNTINLYRIGKIKTVLDINLNTLPPTIWSALKNGKPFNWSAIDEFHDEAAPDLYKLNQLGAKSVVIIPILVADSPEYVFTIASLKKVQTWDKHLIPRIQLLGTLIVSLLQRRKEREILKQREESLAEARHLAHLGDWQTNLDNNEVIWSDELYNILGYEQGEIKASKEAFLDRVHPDDRPLLEKSISVLRSDNQPFSVDHRILLPDGEIKHCQSLGSPRFDDNKKPVFLNGIVQDITNRKLTEDALRKSEKSLATAQRIAHLGSWERNILTNEIVYSDELYRIYGLDKQEQEPKITYDLIIETVHPEDRHLITQAVDMALKNPENTFNIQYRIVRPDGKERIVQSRGEVKLDENGKPHLIFGTTHDITELKTIEAETRRLRNELAHLNRVNTIGNMAAAIAHEINQPLAAILSNSQAAIRFLNFDPPDLNEVREALTDIVSADKRAGEVIRRIRALVKKKEIRNESYSINKVVSEVINLVQNEVLIQNTSLQTKLYPLVPDLYGDHIQVQQVILNLIMNSLEAVRSQPVNNRHIVIDTRIDDNQFVVVSITDSGPGVDEDIIENIFDPFYTTKNSGLGMGLSVCQSIIENHRGRIWFENCSGGGTKFSFQLPLRKDGN